MLARRMNEVEVLRIVRAERRSGWGGGVRYSYVDFRRDLGVDESSEDYLSDSVISSILNGRAEINDHKLLAIIAGNRAAQAAIENSLRLPGLFRCQSHAEIVALLAAVDGEGEQQSRFVVIEGNPTGDVGLTSFETKAIEYLLETLVHKRQPVHHWDVSFNSGASTVIHGLWSSFDVPSPYRAIWIMRPSDFALPYHSELAQLRQFLSGRGHSVASRRALAQAIVAEDILLVFLSPFALDGANGSNAALDLLQEFQNQRGGWTGVCRILIVGQSDTIEKLKIPYREHLSDFLRRRLRLQGTEAFAEFQLQWKRFADLRDEVASEVSGSRMRRAATYFQVQNRDGVWPISVKLRALFASNSRDAAYFDPTQGFKRLAGEVYAHFEDVIAYVEDVSDFIRHVRHLDATARGGSRGKRRYFYLLQYVSTSLHWLTDEALDCLIEKIPPDRLNDLALDTEKRRLRTLAPIVTEKHASATDAPASRYFASMGVKAIVQDDWIAAEPYLRSLAHYRIARRLKTNENDKQLLVQEFPYEPHWGRSRIFFLAEAIRHLVRSCETYVGGASSACGTDVSFPSPPMPKSRGTDPVQVINYCYSVLYQDHLNGNANGKAGRSLAKRYGAYQLSVEMLELVSKDYDVGVPHPALRPDKRLEFMRECGFALLDVGELKRSREVFERARKEAESDSDALDHLSVLLDLALVDCVSGSMPAAEATLAEATERLARLHAEAKTRDTRYYLRVRKLFRRLLTRKAHLNFLSGHHDSALELLDSLENEACWRDGRDGPTFDRSVLVPSFTQSFEAEQIHLKLAALHRQADADRRAGKACDTMAGLNICLREMLHAQSNGLHHQAMGFRIALARCYRRADRLDTAEVILDAVHLDLLRYGCSERTFLSFLNEAGRVLGTRDPVRAYATYLKPCMVRARARGFLREAQQAATQASILLEAIRKAYDAAGQPNASPSWAAQLDAAVDEHRKLIASTEHIFSGDFQEKDPLYAYAIADAEEVIWSLKDPAVIDAEHRKHLDFIAK
jgi:tetratricopeptide (TPR) repeat protein